MYKPKRRMLMYRKPDSIIHTNFKLLVLRHEKLEMAALAQVVYDNRRWLSNASIIIPSVPWVLLSLRCLLPRVLKFPSWRLRATVACCNILNILEPLVCTRSIKI
jgi:hypothetical protein